MTREQLTEWVRARIDEINPVGQTPEIGEIVVGRELDEAAKQILKSARKQLVYPAGVSYLPPVFITQDASGNPKSVIIPLPVSYLRFLRLKMDYWNRPIDDLVGVDSNLYRRQYNAPQISTKNIPALAIVPFQWTQRSETAKTIDTVSADNSLITLNYVAPHGYLQNERIDISGVVGVSGLTGTFKILAVPTTTSILIDYFSSGVISGIMGTSTLHTDTAATVYSQALEAFPAPDDFSAAMGDYQESEGANAVYAEALRLTMVKNTDLTSGKLPIIYDLQIVQALAAEAMPDSLIDAMVWLAAGRCLTTLRQSDLAQAAYGNFNAALGQILIGLKGEEIPSPNK